MSAAYPVSQDEIGFLISRVEAGNPGLVDYYIPFLIKLHALINPSIGIVAVSHVGHCPQQPHPKRPFTLSQQVEAKVDLLRCIRRELAELRLQEGDASDDSVRIGLMGHSVGGQICVRTDRALAAHPYDDQDAAPRTGSGDQQVQALFLLFPSIANIAQTPNGQRLAPLFRPPLLQLAPYLSVLLHPLLYILLLVSKAASSASSSSIFAPNATTLGFALSPSTISNSLHLARDEMREIMDPDMEWYEQNKGRIWSYWGRGDGWVGTMADGVKKVLRGDGRAGTGQHVAQESGEGNDRHIDCVDNVPHAFCLGEWAAGQVCEMVLTTRCRWTSPF